MLAVALGLALGAALSPDAARAALPVAFQPMLQRAESGDAVTAFLLAQRVEYGEPGVLARDEALARRLYRIAAERGHMGAACNLGAMLMDGQGGPADLAAGAQWFRRAALRGHGLAQYNLGVMHALGDGVPRDDAEALAWIEQAVAWLPDPEMRELARTWRTRLLDRMGAGQMGKARFRTQELADQIARSGDPAVPGGSPFEIAGGRSTASDIALRTRADRITADALARVERRAAADPVPPAVALASPTPKIASAAAAPIADPVTAAPDTPAPPPLPASIPAPATATRPSPEAAVRQWAEAWARQRPDDYLAFYDASFVPPDGEARADWEAERRKRLTRPAWLRVRIDDVVTTVEGDHARTRFLQTHTAPPRRVDVSRKTLRWVWRDGAWRIESEQVEPRGKGDRKRSRENAPDVPPPIADAAPAEAPVPAPVPVPAGAPAPDPAPVPPVQAAPAAVPAPAREQAARPSPEAAVRQWAEAWARQRADDHLAFYDAEFTPPDGGARDAWAADRRERLVRPAWLRLRVENIVTTVEGDRARTRFLQTHVVPPHRVDVARTTLNWVWRGTAWRIEREHADPLPAKGERHRSRGRSSAE